MPEPRFPSRVSVTARPRIAAACLALALAAASSCTPRSHMCVASQECGQGACVAGRCVPEKGTPAIRTARRWLYEPVDVAYVRRGDPAEGWGGAVPRSFVLGKQGDGDARVLLRFAVPLPKDANVIEAYVLLEPSDGMDVDPTPIRIHALRVVEPWDSRAVTWSRQPRTEDPHTPWTLVVPATRPFVRVDVRDLVLRWRDRNPADQGIALVADDRSATGVAFHLLPSAGGVDEGRATHVHTGPRLELYVK